MELRHTFGPDKQGWAYVADVFIYLVLNNTPLVFYVKHLAVDNGQ